MRKYILRIKGCRKLVVPPGFEPGSWDPEPHMMDHYTKGLWPLGDRLSFNNQLMSRNL
jgi:hypothetical protein